MISVIAISIILVYLCFLGMLCYGFDRVKPFHLQDLKPKTTFSVIIPFRNEAKTLPHLLNSILKLNYPKNLFEVILIDDDSDDNSVDIIQSFINNFCSQKNSHLNFSTNSQFFLHFCISGSLSQSSSKKRERKKY